MSLKKERRAERLRAADAEDFRRATQTPRDLSQDVHFLAKVQIPLLAEEPAYGAADGSRLEVEVSCGLAIVRVSWVEAGAPAPLAQLEATRQ